jgi:hypothetical protein
LDSSTPRDRIRRAALAAGLLVVGAVVGFLPTHLWFLPDAPAVDWSHVCDGHGGHELHALVADTPVTTVSWFDVTDRSDSPPVIRMRCEAESSDSDVDVTVQWDGTPANEMIHSVLHDSAPEHESMASAQRFAAGDAAEAWPDYAIAAVTCHLPDRTTQAYTVTTQLANSAPGSAATRRRELEALTKEYVAALRATPVCGTG